MPETNIIDLLVPIMEAIETEIKNRLDKSWREEMERIDDEIINGTGNKEGKEIVGILNARTREP